MTLLQPAFYQRLFSGIHRLLLPAEKKRFRLFLFLNVLISTADILSFALLFVVIHWYTQHRAEHALWPIIALMLFFAGKSAGGYFFYQAQYRFAFSVSARLSEQALRCYMNGGYTSYAAHDTAEYVRSIVYAPAEFAQFILSGAQQLLTEILLIVLSVSALLWYNGRLLLIVSCTLTPAVISLYFIIRKKLARIRRQIKTVNEQALQYLHEALHGYVESNIYNRNSFFVQRYAGSQQTVSSFIAGLQITQGIPPRFFEVFAVLGLCLLILASQTTSGHTADVLTLGAFIAATYKIIPGISRVMNLTAQMNTYCYTLQELAKTAIHKPCAREPFAPTPVSVIEGRHLSFSYEGHVIFRHLSFTAQSGQFTGISGPSGKGKTTLLHLLLGFLDTQSGSILFNGQPVSTGERKAWWNEVAYVKQEPLLLHASLLNNIVLFEECYDAGRLAQVLEITGLNTMLFHLPDGLHHLIAENGRNISGGQRQRIAIARALYKKADILLLDEPFNELDEASEIQLLTHFRQLANEGKMILLITHNSKALTFCNNIISLQHV